MLPSIPADWWRELTGFEGKEGEGSRFGPDGPKRPRRAGGE